MRHIAATILLLCICDSSAQDPFRTANFRITKINSRSRVILELMKRQSECGPEYGPGYTVCPGEKSRGCCDTGPGAEQCCPGELVPFIRPVADLISSDGTCCPATDLHG